MSLIFFFFSCLKHSDCPLLPSAELHLIASYQESVSQVTLLYSCVLTMTMTILHFLKTQGVKERRSRKSGICESCTFSCEILELHLNCLVPLVASSYCSLQDVLWALSSIMSCRTAAARMCTSLPSVLLVACMYAWVGPRFDSNGCWKK